MKKQKDFPSSLVVRHYVSTAWDAGVIPDWELRFHVLWPKHLKVTNKFFKVNKKSYCTEVFVSYHHSQPLFTCLRSFFLPIKK